jgi:hypothetical protein
MIKNGAYIHSDDIKNEKTFKMIVSAACDQNIKCNWSWADYQSVQEDGKISRLVARLDFETPFIDIESSPFSNRVRWTVDQWLNIDKSIVTKTNKTINIYVDETDIKVQSHNKVKEMIKDGVNVINTHCLNFFCFDNFLLRNYEVIIHNGEGGYIKISELLGDAKDYGVDKELRKVHNVYKMFIAGAFKFKQ